MKILYESGAINYVQPSVSGPEGTDTALFVDPNLSQYTTGAHGISCTDVDRLRLWTLSAADIEQLFVVAGASDPVTNGAAGVLLSPDGTKLIFWMQATSTFLFNMYLGVCPINEVGDVNPPVLTDYLRMQDDTVALFTPLACWHKEGEGSSLVILTRDFTTDNVQFWICPPIADIEAGTYKGGHPGCDGVLDLDQGPSWYLLWTQADALKIGYDTNLLVQDGNVTRSPVGFMTPNRFWWVMPKAWMQNGSSGISANHAVTYPDGGVFYLDLNYDGYAEHQWPPEAISDGQVLRDGAGHLGELSEARDGSAFFSPALPWTEEYTRIYDGAANEGWIASYQGRPAMGMLDGEPVWLFGVIDGNPTYADDIGMGARAYYAKVRAYRFVGGIFVLAAVAQGIILRDGDLEFTGYNFDAPDSQGIYLYGGQIYFQICQSTEMGSAANSRSVLTKFGRLSGRRTMVTSVRIGQRPND